MLSPSKAGSEIFTQAVALATADESLRLVYQPAYILPSQMDRQDGGLQPEVWLVVALIDQAVAEYRLEQMVPERTIRGNAYGSAVFRARIPAEDWLFKSESQEPWTFRWCCSILGLETEWLRRKLRGLPRDRQRAKRTRPIFVSKRIRAIVERVR